jgi:hypothetical protein
MTTSPIRPRCAQASFIQSHGRTLEYLTGVPAAIVSDQLKPGVRDACRYEPILQRTYEEWAASGKILELPREVCSQDAQSSICLHGTRSHS